MLVANTRLMGPNGIIEANTVLQESDLRPGLAEELLARGLAREVKREEVTVVTAPPAPEASLLDQGRWAFDPKSIATDNIDTLNMKIAGHIQRFGLASVDPFTDAEEARVFMSLEWPKG